jgi:hypothetical protein
MKLLLIVVSILALAGAAAAQTALPGMLLAAVNATTVRQTDYAFDLQFDSSRHNWRAHFEPAGAAPKWRLFSFAPDSATERERTAFARHAADIDGLVWCASEEFGRVADVRLLREDADTATYAYQPTRASARTEQTRRYADRLRGEVTLTKSDPDVTAIHAYAPAPFSPAPLVRLTALDIRVSCAAAPNGRNFVATVETVARGTAFGHDFSDRSVQRIYNLHRPVR